MRFDPAVTGSDWFSQESLDYRRLSPKSVVRPAVGLTLDWAHDSLVTTSDTDEDVAIIENQVYLHLGGSLVLWDRLRVEALLPIRVQQSGDDAVVGGQTVSADAGAGVGDLRLGVDGRLVGEYGGPASLALGLQLWAPTGSRDAWSSDGSVRVRPRIMGAGDLGIFAWSAQVGVNLRFVEENPSDVAFGNELAFGVAAGVRLVDKKLLLGPELYGSTVLEDGGGFEARSSPFELLLGGHYRIAKDWNVGAAAGPGLSIGLGTPAVRVLASVTWFPAPREEAAPLDSDGDGILDEADACPTEKGEPSDDPKQHGCPPPPDGDGDGILDSVDACPGEKGDPHAEPKEHGCPKAVMVAGQIKILDKVQFDHGKATLRPESDAVLEAVRAILEAHPEVTKVSVEGHTDTSGAPYLNRQLSARRAAAVVEWLVAHGIEKARLTSAGFGPDRPIADNDTEEGREANRRVEFHVVEIDGKPADSTSTVK